WGCSVAFRCGRAGASAGRAYARGFERLHHTAGAAPGRRPETVPVSMLALARRINTHRYGRAGLLQCVDSRAEIAPGIGRFRICKAEARRYTPPHERPR